MTEAQKEAREIYDKFYRLTALTDTCFGICEEVKECSHTGHGCYLWKVHAKQCALLALQMQMKSIPEHVYQGGYEYNNPEYAYAKEVQHELEII